MHIIILAILMAIPILASGSAEQATIPERFIKAEKPSVQHLTEGQSGYVSCGAVDADNQGRLWAWGFYEVRPQWGKGYVMKITRRAVGVDVDMSEACHCQWGVREMFSAASVLPVMTVSGFDVCERPSLFSLEGLKRWIKGE